MATHVELRRKTKAIKSQKLGQSAWKETIILFFRLCIFHGYHE